MSQQIQARLTKLELLNHLYESLSEHGSNLKDTFKAISEIIQSNLESRYIDFVVLDKNNPVKANIYSISRKGEFNEYYTDIVGISKYSIQSRKTTVEEDVTKNPHYTEWRKNIKSEICLPISHKRKIIGCINLEFTTPQKFDKDTVTTLEIITKAVGTTIHTTVLNEEIRASENKFRKIVENMNEGLWLGDEKHNTVYVNPTFEKMTGLSYEECLKRDCFGFYDKESVERIHEHHKLRETKQSSQYELTIIKPDGKKLPVLCSGSPIIDGTIGMFTDLSIIKELSKSEKLLAHVSDSSIDAIVSLDRNLVIRTWNKGAIKMFGYEKDEIIGKNIKIIISQEKIRQEELEEIIKITLEKGFIRNHETVRITKSGKEINVSISITKLTDEKDRFIGFGVIYRDISYQKKAEKELQTRFESMQNAYMELGKQRRELDYLLETLSIAIGDEQFPDIENYIVNAAIMLTKANAATLRLYNKKDGFLHLKAASGVKPEWWGKSRTPLEGTLAEKAYNIRKPLFVNELQNNPQYTSQKLATEHGFISALIIPLYVKTKYVGNLSLYSNNKNKLHLIDNSFIANFGKQASLALFTKSV